MCVLSRVAGLEKRRESDVREKGASVVLFVRSLFRRKNRLLFHPSSLSTPRNGAAYRRAGRRVQGACVGWRQPGCGRRRGWRPTRARSALSPRRAPAPPCGPSRPHAAAGRRVRAAAWWLLCAARAAGWRGKARSLAEVRASRMAHHAPRLSSPTSGSFRALRQGRRRHHHHQGAGHRHAVAGAEPDRGGAAGAEERRADGGRKRVFSTPLPPSHSHALTHPSPSGNGGRSRRRRLRHRRLPRVPLPHVAQGARRRLGGGAAGSLQSVRQGRQRLYLGGRGEWEEGWGDRERERGAFFFCFFVFIDTHLLSPPHSCATS